MAVDTQRRAVPGWVIGLACAGAIVVVPLVAHRIDRQADEFDRRHFAVGASLGWAVCAVLFAIVVTRLLHIAVGVDVGSVFAVAYDGLPVLLVGAWLVLVIALVRGHVLLAAVAAALCAYHLVLLVPRLVTSRTPHWARHAPKLDIVVANVFIDNATPDDAARQLVARAVDIVVIVESTDAFMSVFDRQGGEVAYPHRVSDPDDDSDYAVTLATKHELGPRSAMKKLGPLRLAIADIDVGGRATLVVALNPMATVDPDGHETWKEQIDVLKEFVPTLTGPFVIAGDLNTTRYRPEFAELLSLGLTDAIDSLGKGLNPSFKLGADGVLGSIGPVARLDHALLNDDVHAMSVENLEPCGSDHMPFELTVAVRAAASSARPHRTGSRRRVHDAPSAHQPVNEAL